jgi:RecJ-like exonuclease
MTKMVEVSDDWCEACRGTGQVALHGIALTSFDLAEWSQEELEDYAVGNYDTPCEVCRGSGHVSGEDAQAYYEDRAMLRAEAPHLFQ